MHKFVGTLRAKAVQTLVSFSSVVAYDNLEGCCAANNFCRNVVVTTAAAET
jgi:hypothetical protein